MKFTCLQENFKSGLAVVSHVVGKNVNLPILNNILVRAQKSHIELLATNLEIGVIHKVRGKVEIEGELTVDAKTVSDYVNLLPLDKIETEKIEDDFLIQCDGFKTKIKCQTTQEFPLIPSIEKNTFFSLKLDDFKEAISQVIFAVSNNENRAELSGVLFSIKGKSLVMAATDSYRLAEKKVPISESTISEDRKVIVPAKTLQEVLRIMSVFKEGDEIESGSQIKICLSENQILFLIGSTELVSKLIVGQYPDYEQIIPNNFKTSVIFEKPELVRAIKASAIFSKVGINDVSLVFKKDSQDIIVSSSSSQVGESTVNLRGEIGGDNNDVIINYRYLLDGLNNLTGDKVKMDIVNYNTPCIISSENNPSYLYIVMPIRQ